MHEVSISVVIPLYNKEQYIVRALQSIFAQTVNNYEVIVVDDGSTDKGPDIVEEINDPRARLIKQRNGGVSAARNRGIEEAKGDLVAFLDADDEWTPSFLETIINLSKSYPEAGVYATAFKTISPNGEIIAPYSKPKIPGLKDNIFHNFFAAEVNKDLDIHISSVAIHKVIFKRLGGFLVGERLGEDLELYCRICIKYPIAFSYSVCGIYHHDVVNSALQSNIVVNELPFVKTAQTATASITVDTGLVRDLKEYIAKHQLWYVRKQVLGGNCEAARMVLKQCDTTRYYLRKLWWIFWALVPAKFTRYAFILNNRCRLILK